MLERRVGQHDSEIMILWRYALKLKPCRREDNRTGQRGQQCFSIRREDNEFPCNLDIFRHDGEGLFFPILSFA
jgi:hypothetical protein